MKTRLRGRHGEELGIVPINLLHPCFEQPADDRTSVRRYLDFPKFVDLLLTKELNLQRMDKLNDKFEGRRGRNYEKEVRLDIEQKIAAGMIFLGRPGQTAEDFATECAAQAAHYELLIPQVSFVNCWNMGDDESEALWRIYGADPAAVSVVVPYGRLRDSIVLNHELYMGMVNYFDFEAVSDKRREAMWPLMNKRKQFEYEREVRLVKMDSRFRIVDPEFAGRNIARPDRPTAQRVGWDVETFAEKVVISPYASAWQQTLIRATVDKICPALGGRVVESIMR